VIIGQRQYTKGIIDWLLTRPLVNLISLTGLFLGYLTVFSCNIMGVPCTLKDKIIKIIDYGRPAITLHFLHSWTIHSQLHSYLPILYLDSPMIAGCLSFPAASLLSLPSWVLGS